MTIMNTDGVRRLHWGCGRTIPISWICSDLKPGLGIDIASDIPKGLCLDDDSIDYIFS